MPDVFQCSIWPATDGPGKGAFMTINVDETDKNGRLVLYPDGRCIIENQFEQETFGFGHSKQISVYVETADGDKGCFTVGLFDTIKDLRHKACKQFHEPLSETRLVFAGQHLQDDIAVRSSGIRERCTLRLQPAGLRRGGEYFWGCVCL